MSKVIRSPLFYVGDKYKLINQLKEVFPNNINTFYDVFCGGGSVSINIDAKNFVMNDLDSSIISLHSFLQETSTQPLTKIKNLKKIAKDYGFSISEDGINSEIEEEKKIYPKTYFAKYNKEPYLKLRKEFNSDKSKLDYLYLLLIYGFNHMVRFNKLGEFNLPVGNVDWNKNVTESLIDYMSWSNKSKKKLMNLDFQVLVSKSKLNADDFMYFDPPYLISYSDYNKYWSEEDDLRLYNLLDDLDNKGIKWGLSNLLYHKGRKNQLLEDWLIKYNVYSIKSNYISRFDNSVKPDSKEIYVTNVDKM
jgi:DNA adenine methylase